MILKGIIREEKTSVDRGETCLSDTYANNQTLLLWVKGRRLSIEIRYCLCLGKLQYGYEGQPK